MIRPRAILFDLGETLIHFAGADRAEMFRQGARAGHAYLLSQGLRLPPAERFVNSLLWRGRKAVLLNRISRREIDVAAMFAAAIGGLGRLAPEPIWQEFIRRLYLPLAEAGRLDPQARDVLLRLRAAGLKTALISNTFVPEYAISDHLRRVGIDDLFDITFLSAEIGLKKPSLWLFRHVLKSLAVRPGEAWHVGDNIIADVLGARRAGLVPVLRLLPGERMPWWLGAWVPSWAPSWWPMRPKFVITQLEELIGLLGLE